LSAARAAADAGDGTGKTGWAITGIGGTGMTAGIAATARCRIQPKATAVSAASPMITSDALRPTRHHGDAGVTERTASPLTVSPPARPVRWSRSCSIALMMLIRHAPFE
jgi:hypothetical protein